MDLDLELGFGGLLTDFLGERSIAIVDPSKTARTAIASSLANEGVRARQIITASNYNEAVSSIIEQPVKVGILITDYMIGSRSGIELANEVFADESDLQKIAVFILTNSGHQSGVVEAAEGLADSYILKPFSDVILKTYMNQVLTKKTQPNPTATVFRILKTKLRSKDYQGVLQDLETAKRSGAFAARLTSLPSVFEAQAYEGLKDMENCELSYQRALSIQPKSYPAISGLYRIYFAQKNKEKAYQMLSTISQLFPLSPQRLCEAITLAVETRHFEDVEKYYKLFAEIDERRDELVKTMSAALMVSAIYGIQNKQTKEAISLFQRAIVTSRRNPQFIGKAILYSLAYGETKAADKFLEMFDAIDMETTAYLASKYLVKEVMFRDDKEKLEANFNAGIRLTQGRDCPIPVFRVLLKQAVEMGKEKIAESLKVEALSRWEEHELQASLYEFNEL